MITDKRAALDAIQKHGYYAILHISPEMKAEVMIAMLQQSSYPMQYISQEMQSYNLR